MKKHLSTILKVALSLLILWLLYRRIDPAAMREKLQGIRLLWLVPAFLLLAANTLVSALKWRLLLAADGIRQPLGRLFASFLTGSFFNLFLPSTIGGDAYRIADIGRHTRRAAHTAASILADRLTGFLALAICGLAFPLLTIFLAPGAIPNWSHRFLILPALALCALILVTLILIEQRLPRLLIKTLPSRLRDPAARVLDKILASVQAYIHAPRAWFGSLLLSFLFQFIANTAVFCLARAIGLPLSLLPFFCFIPFITLMEMIPISIFGLGLRDTGYAWFMQAVGHTRLDAATLSLLYVATTIAYVSLGGLLFILRRPAAHQ